MSYNRNQRSRGSRPPQGKKGGPRQYPPEVQAIWKKMTNMKNWAEYDINEITKENGAAYLIAMEIQKDRKPEPTQLRKYYDEIVRGAMLLKRNKKDIERVKRIIAMLNPRIKYAHSRKLVGDTFVNYITLATNAQKFRNTPEEFKEDFERFMNFFEAIVGYYTYLRA